MVTEAISIRDKVRYVKAQKQTRFHECHGGCGKQVPPAMWGCRECWRTLPLWLRNKIWQHYRPGQEIDGKPSADYLTVAREVDDFLRSRKVITSTQAVCDHSVRMSGETTDGSYSRTWCGKCGATL